MTEPPDQPTPPHQRRPRYRGTHPRRFDEKYKELAPEHYPEIVAHLRERGQTPAGQHVPVLVEETLAALGVSPGQRGVDATVGWGGHAGRFLERLAPGGTLLALDADPIELPKTEARLRRLGFGTDALIVRRTNFAGLAAAVADVGWDDGFHPSAHSTRAGGPGFHPSAHSTRAGGPGFHPSAHSTRAGGPGADFVFADLGVSSMQIDDPARGFSFKIDGPLDMRMNPNRGLPAAAWLERATADALAAALAGHADEPHAAEIAAALTARRGTLTTTRALAEAVRAALDGRVPDDDAALSVRRVFQALRIEVNDELGALDALLRQLPRCLRPGGRAALITFHSGEDRRVKRAFADGQRAGLYAEVADEIVRASPAEQRANPRARSAKLRAARRA